MPFDRVAILGTGLIGTSVGLALKAQRPSPRVLGFDISREAALAAQKAGALDRAVRLDEAVRDAPLVVVCTPVGAMPLLFEHIAAFLPADAVVTDTGSSKAEVLDWAAQYLPASTQFVGGHPLAARTETGPAAADATLFQGSAWCLVPALSASQRTIEHVVEWVQSLGATPYFLDAAEHDGLAASVSEGGLPYLAAAALLTHLGREASWRESATLAGTAFSYATHLAGADPQAAADVLRTNRANAARRLELYITELTRLRDTLLAADDAALLDTLTRAHALHADWLAGRAQGTPTADDSTRLPSTSALLRGSLFGALGRPRRP